MRNADAVREIRTILKEHNAEHIEIISKIENSEGIENLDKIIQASDGIMVARGDMGVEIPAYEVPHVQKMIVEKCNQKYKPVIIATQMLDSMIRNPRPTRAVRTATNVQAACIVTPTVSGQTARLMSNFRPAVPIYAVTPNEWAQRKMQLYWGVTPLKGYEEDTTEHIISHAMYVVKREGYVKEGDMVVFTAGDPATNMVKGKGAMTNMMHVIEAK